MAQESNVVGQSKIQDWVTAGFATFEQQLNGGKASAVHNLRGDAFSSLIEQGFPTTKNEEWKYTNVQQLVKTPFKLVSEPPSKRPALSEVQEYLVAGAETPRLVFVDGLLDQELSTVGSLEEGISVCSLRELSQEGSDQKELIETYLGTLAKPESQAFVALNTAFLNDGAVIHAKSGACSKQPIQLLFLASAERSDMMLHPRVLILAEERSELTVVETYVGVGENTYFTSAVTEVSVSAEAKVDHYKLQFEGPEGYHVSTIEAHQQEKSVFSTHSFSFGGKLVRNDVNPTLDGEYIETTMNGLNVVSGSQHIDNHTVIDHAKPHCLSNECYKGIYAGKSKGVFNGTIIVRQDAQKTNAIQSSQSLLLSNEAESNSKPQLKIWADDVRCTHGATVGQIDQDALFYLRSRGLDKEAAQDILIQAFAGDIIEQVEVESIREFLEDKLLSKLAAERA